MKKVNQLTLIAVLLIAVLSGCMTSRLMQKPDSDGNGPRVDTHWNFLWGQLTENDLKASCGSQNICQVEVRTNFGFQILAVITLGIVVPQKIVWECCPEDPEVDTLGKNTN